MLHKIRQTKLFKRLQLLWRETGNRNGEGIEEPGEVRARNLMLILLLITIPPLLLVLYCRVMFPGLTNPDAMDFAQLGRNLSSGQGFVTHMLRPLALEHGPNILHQPEVTHGPLYPFILALAFGIFGSKDAVVAGVSGIFYLLTIPVLYILSVRLFNRAVGILTALIFIGNALMLEYASSGLHITLYIFLATCLFLTVSHFAPPTLEASPSKNARSRR